MRSTDYGPVPVSRMKSESKQIFEALAQGRRVVVSNRGRIVAAINPPTEDRLVEVAAYALPREQTIPELTASQINDSASKAVKRAIAGESIYVTRSDRVFGFLEGVEELADEPGEPDLEQLTRLDGEVLEYIDRHPAATAADVRNFRSQRLQETGITGKHGQPGDELQTMLTLGMLLSPKPLMKIGLSKISLATQFAAQCTRRMLERDYASARAAAAVAQVRD